MPDKPQILHRNSISRSSRKNDGSRIRVNRIFVIVGIHSSFVLELCTVVVPSFIIVTIIIHHVTDQKAHCRQAQANVRSAGHDAKGIGSNHVVDDYDTNVQPPQQAEPNEKDPS